MSQDKQMKAVSPLLQQVINISSIVGGVGSLIFCIWAYQAGILQSKETLSAFIQQAGIWGPPLFIFLQILQTVVPIIPGALTSVAGVFIYGHIIGLSTTISASCWLCRSLLSGAPLWSALSVRRQQASPMTSISAGWIRAIVLTVSLLFMMIWPISPADFALYAGRPDQDELQALYDHHRSDQTLYPRGLYLRSDLYYRLFLANALTRKKIRLVSQADF